MPCLSVALNDTSEATELASAPSLKSLDKLILMCACLHGTIPAVFVYRFLGGTEASLACVTAMKGLLYTC